MMSTLSRTLFAFTKTFWWVRTFRRGGGVVCSGQLALLAAQNVLEVKTFCEVSFSFVCLHPFHKYRLGNVFSLKNVLKKIAAANKNGHMSKRFYP